MARPTSLPEWASGGAADIVEPSAGKKLLGWISAERPPAQYLNWLLKRINDWIDYLDTATDPIAVPACSFAEAESGGATNLVHLVGDRWSSDDTDDGLLQGPLIAPVGYILSTLDVYVREGNAVGERMTIGVYSLNFSTGVSALISSAKSTADTGANVAISWTDADADFPLTFQDGYAYSVEVVMPSTTSDDETRLYGAVMNG